MHHDDTIVAIASAPGYSARSLIRLSGPGAFDHLDRITQSTQTDHSRGLQVHRLTHPPLPCLISTFPAPNSYTGENSVEIQLPGNPHLLARIINEFINQGARQADPGEFTARAYFNDKLTLTEAEGVAATIAASSESQLRAARMLTDGQLGQLAETLTNQLTETLALVEAGIDFTDQEDVHPIGPADLHHRVRSLCSTIESILSRAVKAEHLNALPHVVLVGPPNAGKSTLFNALLGKTRAVVSPLSGTTRDVLTEPMRLDTNDPHSPEVMLVDLAGIDDTTKTGLNPQMQSAARGAIRNADLIISLHPPEHTEITKSIESTAPAIHIRSKADLNSNNEYANKNKNNDDALPVSVHQPDTIDQLRRYIADHLTGLTYSLSAEALALQPRHEHALRTASDQLAQTADQLTHELASHHPLQDEELIAAQLRLAHTALEQLIGRITPDDILEHVFAKFCIGK